MDDPMDISEYVKIQHSMLSEDGTLKYDFMTSLQKIAMARIVSSLWMNQNILQRMMKLNKRERLMMLTIFNEIKDDILAKVSQLLLPNSICQELRYLVPVFKNSIVSWVNYHNHHILIPEKAEYSAVNLICYITWTARGKIDYVKTAKNILENSDICLSDDHKYKLACTYCLEDEISLLSSKVVNKSYLFYIEIDIEPMVYFWTAQITGDMTQLNNPRSFWNRNRYNDAMSINERIIRLLIKTNVISDKAVNDVPIRFMWNKLSEEEKNKNIAFLFKNVHNADILISLLSNLDYKQQKNMLKECSGAVLYAILNDWWWWGIYFLPTALNVLDVMDPLSFWKILRELNGKKGMSSEKNMCDHFKSLFKLLWQESSLELKEFIFHDKYRRLDEFVIYELDWEQDVDVIEIIFKDLNTEQKTNIAFGEDGIKRCAYFIQSDKWDALDLFIKCTLSSDDKICQLKQRLMQRNGKEVAMSFFSQREFHKLEHFLNWAFNSEDERSLYRQSLNYKVLPLTQ